MGGDIVWTAGRIASIVRYILFIAREYICMHLQHSFFWVELLVLSPTFLDR